MKTLKILVITILLFAFMIPASVRAAGEYENTLFELSISLLKELKYLDKIDNARLAVLGFHAVGADSDCREFSLDLANRINSNINKIKSLLDTRFTTVPRHDLEAIETEYLISHAGSDRDVMARVAGSDILITGTWHDYGHELGLTIKAVSIKDADMLELTTITGNIIRESIPSGLLNCLTPVKSGPVKIERVSGGSIDWRSKIITVKGFGLANKTFPQAIWKKSAEEAAIMDAQTKLLEIVNGALLKSQTFVVNYKVNRSETVKKIEGKLPSAIQIGSTIYPTLDTAEVEMQLDLRDAL
ncbi:hypothetical protein KAI46_10670 [bacterium]|nr:hypothetical protein [bacterium]